MSIQYKTKDEIKPSPLEVIGVDLAKGESSTHFNEHDITTTTTKKNGSKGVESSETEIIGKVMTIEPLCNIGVNAKRTINIGNYNSITLGVSINIPCAYELIETTYLEAKEFIDNKMDNLTKDIDETTK